MLKPGLLIVPSASYIDFGWDLTLGYYSTYTIQFVFYLDYLTHMIKDKSMLRDKMSCTVRFGYCFLRVPLIYQPCRLVPCYHGKLGELVKKPFTKQTLQFILSLSSRNVHCPKTLLVSLMFRMVNNPPRSYSTPSGGVSR